MKTYHLHIKGRVQGVGFRPFVYGLAKKLGLKGTVANTKDGVHIFVSMQPEQLKQLIGMIRRDAPAQAVITDLQHDELPARDYVDFRIVDSDDTGEPDLLISPDFALCDNCRAELWNPANRRYLYPYITCTHCGPRYSIIKELPFDRCVTAMHHFDMCHICAEEYAAPDDTRFYSQTNSCATCGIHQWVLDRKGERVNIKAASEVDFICKKIEAGKLVAIKGIGGFLLMCDAGNTVEIEKLRRLKQRPSKPFAMLYPNLAQVRNDFVMSAEEEEALCSAASPIILLRPKTKNRLKKLQKSMAPGLNRLGVMLPCAPLLELIAMRLDRPLLATSANHKGSPIIFKNREAAEVLPVFADYILMNDREIVVPQDDTVMLFSSKKHQKTMMRRSRGFAPAYTGRALPVSFDVPVLAMGALLKGTFCVWQRGRCHISQYLGDTTSFDAQQSYEHTLSHIRKLLRCKPEVVVVDKHPAYFTSLLGKEIAVREGVDVLEVQHHEAHAWAVLGEHSLLKEEGPVMIVVFDGTGMGNDGAIWGGEFFMFQNQALTRYSHLAYYPHILGDKMAREPRLSALSVMHQSGMEYPSDNGVFSKEERAMYDKIISHSTLMTSSMGRLFDAVSSLLGLCHYNTYEGQAAMSLQCAAEAYYHSHMPPTAYPIGTEDSYSMDVPRLIRHILRDLRQLVSRKLIAARFHETVVQYVCREIARAKCNKIAFSGGVFQNGLLIDRLTDLLGEEKSLYFHENLSPNDEGISYGQLVACYQTVRRNMASEQKQLKEQI